MRNTLKRDKPKSHKAKMHHYSVVGGGLKYGSWIGDKKWIKGQVATLGQRKMRLIRCTHGTIDIREGK